jgi:SAM-dependent methyltransferase
MSDKLSDYYEECFIAAGKGGSIYNSLTILEEAGHNRKGELLALMELPDLSSLTVVDYGVGSWGFGCVFPKIKDCKVAIGVDISQYAVDCSRKISEEDLGLKGKETQFFTSGGYDIKLHDEVADIVFAGECIEHIEDTESFLSEIWRILKLEGLAIFTTPNSQPYIYKQQNIKWAMGFEHVALMDSESLINELQKFFIIESKKGYMSSIDPKIDPLIDDASFAAEWAKMCENDFHKATGLIVKVKKTTNKNVPITKTKMDHVIVNSESVECISGYSDLSLYEEILGRMPVGDRSYLSVPIPCNAIRGQIILWSHPWSGIACIETLCFKKEVDLYSHVSGCVRVTLVECDLSACDEIRILRTGQKRRASKGDQVIFFRAVFTVLSDDHLCL